MWKNNWGGGRNSDIPLLVDSEGCERATSYDKVEAFMNNARMFPILLYSKYLVDCRIYRLG